MRHRHRCLLALAGLALTGCARPSAETLYRELRERYTAAQTLHSKATLSLQAKGRPESALTVDLETWARRPAELRCVSRDPLSGNLMTVLASPAGVFQETSHEGRSAFLKAPAVTTLADLLAEGGPMLPGSFPGLRVGDELSLFCGVAPETADLTLSERVRPVGQLACWELTVTLPDQPACRLLIGQADGLLRGLEFEIDHGDGQLIEVAWTIASITLDEPIDDQAFALTIPPETPVVEAANIRAAEESLLYGLDRPAPAFDLPTLIGDARVSLADLRGQPAVLDFWLTTCAPCETLQPHLERLHRELGDRVHFVMISPEPATTVKPVVAARQLAIRQLLDPGQKAVEAFAVEGFPTTILLDREGIIRRVHRGVDPQADLYATYRAELDELLRSPRAEE